MGKDRFAPPDAPDTTIVPLVDAAQTPPFLTDRRVVVGREIEMFTKAAQVAPLVDYLGIMFRRVVLSHGCGWPGWRHCRHSVGFDGWLGQSESFEHQGVDRDKEAGA